MTPRPDAVDADHRALAATIAGGCPAAPVDPLLAALQRALLARRVAEPALTGRALLASVADEHPTAAHRFLRWLEGRQTATAAVGAQVLRLPLVLPRQHDERPDERWAS